MFRLLLLQICSLFLLPLLCLAQSQLDPDIDWKQIKTEHFLIVYDAKFRNVAVQYAHYAEQAYTTLVPLYREAPAQTIVLINDNTDAANAFATSLPYPFINIYPVFPSSFDGIADHANWGYELIAHEFGHILTFEPSHGIFNPLRYILGAVARPNFLLPRWFHEGVSVNLETLYTTQGGRLKSSQEFGDMRALVESKTLRLENLSRLNDSVPDWLGGRRPYLFGALLIHEIIRQKNGPQAIVDMVQSYSSGVPYLIQSTPKALLGKDFTELLDETYTRLEKNSEEQFKTIKSAISETGQQLPQTGYESHGPRISPDGQFLASIGRTDTRPNVLEVIKADEATTFRKLRIKVAYEGQKISRVSWFPDSKRILFDDLKMFKRYSSFSDLFIYDIRQSTARQITKGLRASDGTVSPNGQLILFRQNLEGRTRLCTVDSNGENFKVVYEPDPQIRVSQPEFLDDKRFVFTERNPVGREVLKVKEFDNFDPPKELFADYVPAYYPRLTSHGLLFTSSKSGVPNIYLANADLTDARAVTNTTTRTLEGDLHPLSKELFYSKQTGVGPRLFRLNFVNWNLHPKMPPHVGSLIDYDWPKFELPLVNPNTTEEDYSPWPHLIPRYWIPMALIIQEGWMFQGQTASQDPTGRHSYSLLLGYDTVTTKMSAMGSYSNKTTPVQIDLSGGRFYEYLYSARITRENTFGSLVGSFIVPNFFTNWQVSFGLTMNEIVTLNRNQKRAGPTLGFNYSKVVQRGLDITPEQGGAFQLLHTQYLPQLGTMEYGQTNATASYYHRKWLPERHGIALNMRGQFAPKLEVKKNFDLFSTTQNGVYQYSLLASPFLMRGYSTGVFLGKTLLNPSLEYRFPLSYPYEGYGTLPAFIKKWHGSLFMDFVALDGISFRTNGKSHRELLRKGYASVGAEIKADITLGYMLPAQLFLGLYYGLDQQAYGGFTPFFGFIF